MTVAWNTARTDLWLDKTLCAGSWKIKTYAPTEFVPCHVLSPANTDIIVIEIFDRALRDLCAVGITPTQGVKSEHEAIRLVIFHPESCLNK